MLSLSESKPPEVNMCDALRTEADMNKTFTAWEKGLRSRADREFMINNPSVDRFIRMVRDWQNGAWSSTEDHAAVRTKFGKEIWGTVSACKERGEWTKSNATLYRGIHKTMREFGIMDIKLDGTVSGVRTVYSANSHYVNGRGVYESKSPYQSWTENIIRAQEFSKGLFIGKESSRSIEMIMNYKPPADNTFAIHRLNVLLAMQGEKEVMVYAPSPIRVNVGVKASDIVRCCLEGYPQILKFSLLRNLLGQANALKFIDMVNKNIGMRNELEKDWDRDIVFDMNK